MRTDIGIRTYHVPGRIEFGFGASQKVGDEAKNLGLKKPLVLMDEGVAKIGLGDPIIESIKKAGLEVAVFPRVLGEAPISRIEEAYEVFKAEGCDGMVAIGGGSAMDSAKSLGVLVNDPGPLRRYAREGKKVTKRIPPLITIPTTAGTGAEISSGSILTDDRDHVRCGLGSPLIASYVALVDPNMSKGLPPFWTACTGLDAMGHGIERYTFHMAVPHTDAMSRMCIVYGAKYLRRAVANGDDMEARMGMAACALMGGMARTGAGYAHDVSSPLSVYYDIPHGLGVALPLPYVMDFNVPGNVEKFIDIAQIFGERTEGIAPIDAAYLASVGLKKLMRDVGLPLTLKEHGITDPDAERKIMEQAPPCNTGCRVGGQDAIVKEIIRPLIG